MNKLNKNTTDLQTILEVLNKLPVLKTHTVTIKADPGITLQMYTATTLSDSVINTVSDSNMTFREENFAMPVLINNVLTGSCVTFMFTGAIMNAVKIEGDAELIDLGTGNYAVKPMGDCVITCYDRD